MSPKLEELLLKLDPKYCWDKTEKELNLILARYEIARNTISSQEEFRYILNDFTWKIFHPANEDENLSRTNFAMYDIAIGYLKKIYGDRAQIITYNIMSSGAEGGVYKILSQLTNQTIESWCELEAKSLVGKYFNSITMKERQKASEEYLERYKDILPWNYRNDPLQVFISFEEVLVGHGKMIKRLRGS